MDKLRAMAKARKPDRVPITVRIDAALAARMRKFVYDNCGVPLRCRSLGILVSQSVIREMDRLELILSGALPLDRAAGKDVGDDDHDASDPPLRHRRPLNSTRT